MGTMARILASAVMAVVIAAGCSNEIEPPSGIANLPAKPETPRGLTAAIGDGRVTVSWIVTNPAVVERYLVYSSDSSTAEMALIDSTPSTSYTVEGLVNGRPYYFAVAAVTTDGIEGERSGSIRAVPGVFSILVESGQKYTNGRAVTVGLTAPQGTSLVQLSEDSTFAAAHWENMAASRNLELSEPDGLKRIFARFQLSGAGGSAGTVFDEIILDRVAKIDSVTVRRRGQVIPADSVLKRGDTIRLAVYISEEGSSASAEISGLETVTLNDFGAGGDAMAGDSIYSADYIIPAGAELVRAEVTGRFTDAAGNEAPAVISPTRLNATSAPDAVALSGYQISSSELQLVWSRSDADDFASYRLFRSLTTTVDSTSFLVTILTAQSAQSYNDTGLVDEKYYYYRLYVCDKSGNAAASNRVTLRTPINDPPAAITIAANVITDTLPASVDISWVQAGDADFKSYQIFRSTIDLTGFTDAQVIATCDLIKIIGTRSTVSYTDHVAVADDYYYKVMVFDKQGKYTGSNMASVTVTP
jgi:fibronectin type 3 domain-containing protein